MNRIRVLLCLGLLLCVSMPSVLAQAEGQPTIKIANGTVVTRPDATVQVTWLLDKGSRTSIEAWGYTAHIRSRSQEAQDKAHVPGYRARRWVVERTHS
jgi:putative transposase